MWNRQHFEHLESFKRAGIANHPFTVTLPDDRKMYVATDLRVAVALDKVPRDEEDRYPETPTTQLPGSLLAQLLAPPPADLDAARIWTNFRKLWEWAGDAAASPRPAYVLGVPIDRGLLARGLASDFGGSASCSLDRVRLQTGSECLIVAGGHWRVLVVEYTLPADMPAPRYEP